MCLWAFPGSSGVGTGARTADPAGPDTTRYPGAPEKKFRVVFVFENEKVFNKFVNSGWEFGGQSTAAAKLDEEGGAFTGAATVSPGVWIYQLTEDGLALELTVKGTKYMKDNDLN